MQRIFSYLALLLTAILFLLVNTGFGQEEEGNPTAVEVVNFTAAAQEGGIRLDWETATELNSAGFQIERGVTGSDEFSYLDYIGLIPAIGDVATGATYTATDGLAVYGETYTYVLIEVDHQAQKTVKASTTVTYIITPTATPIIIGSNDPGTTPTPTTIPTSTPMPTATPVNPTPTSTLQPAKVDTPEPLPPEPLTPVARSTEPVQIITRDENFSAQPEDDSAITNIALAQEQNPTAYPGPEIFPPPTSESAYPDDQQSPAEEPLQPDRAFTGSGEINSEIPPTIAVIGSDVGEYPLPGIVQAESPSAEAVRGRLFLWLGFIIALFIFLTGVVGSIILYRRR